MTRDEALAVLDAYVASCARLDRAAQEHAAATAHKEHCLGALRSTARKEVKR